MSDIGSEILFFGESLVEAYNMISNHILDNMSPQINILNMVIPILIYFSTCLLLKSLFYLKSEYCKPHKAVSHPTKCDLIYDVNYF